MVSILEIFQMGKFSRKNFFKGLAIGTISLPFVLRGLSGKSVSQQSSANIITQKKYKWKMVTTWPPNFPILGEGCQHFAEWVNVMSGGRIEIKVFGGGELVPPLESFDAVRNGAAELASSAAYYWAGKIPAAQFFAAVPFGMNAQQINTWLYSGGGLQLWEELYADYNLFPMAGGNTGVQMGGWFNKEITTLSDFKGLKMRMPGLGGKVLEKAGGAPVLLAGSELYTGLERGIIDATEWIGPFHDYMMGFHQIARYYYVNGWHEPGTVLEIIMNKSVMDELPDDLKAIVKTAAYRLNHWTLSEIEAQNSIYLNKLINEENVSIRTFSRDILDTLRDYAKDAINELAASDQAAQKVYTSYSQFQKNISRWSDNSERMYFEGIQS